MRRAICLVLLTVGVFGASLGLLLRFYAYPRLAVAPLDPQITSVAHGTATIFSPDTLTARPNVPTTTTIRVRGKIDAPEVKINGSVALWVVGQVTEDDRGTVVDATEQWVCVDRRTGMAVQPCAEQKLGDDTGVRATGLQLKFPFNTQRRDYPYYDSAARQAFPMRYDGDELLDGLPVYRFVQTVPVTKLADIDVPGNLVGGSAKRTVRAARMYEGVRTMWVEPYTGQIIKGQQRVHQFLRGPNGRNGQTLFDGTLGSTTDSVQTTVAQAMVQRDGVRLLYDSGPRLLVGAGVLVFLAGLALLATGPGRLRLGRRRPADAPERPTGIVYLTIPRQPAQTQPLAGGQLAPPPPPVPFGPPLATVPINGGTAAFPPVAAGRHEAAPTGRHQAPTAGTNGAAAG